MTCGLLGFTGDTDLLIFSSENEQTSPIASSSSGGRGDLRILLRAGEEDLGMHIVEVIYFSWGIHFIIAHNLTQ